MNIQGISNKVILVTGAAGGIGRAISRELCEKGASVIMTDRNEQALHAAFQELERYPNRAKYQADITSLEDLDGLFAWANAHFGGIDHLVNNAGIVTRGKLESFSDDDWYKVLDINLTSVYQLTKRYAKDRIQKGTGGAIVNIASMAYKGMTQQIAYSSSKGGVVTLTKSTALELARHGVRANAVAPGMIETDMTRVSEGEKDSLREKMVAQIPMRRYGQPHEIAKTVTFLLSDDASYISGEIIHVSGGARL